MIKSLFELTSARHPSPMQIMMYAGVADVTNIHYIELLLKNRYLGEHLIGNCVPVCVGK